MTGTATITLESIENEMREELASAGSETERKMIMAEYKARIQKLVVEGEKAYVLAYIKPYGQEDNCGCRD